MNGDPMRSLPEPMLERHQELLGLLPQQELPQEHAEVLLDDLFESVVDQRIGDAGVLAALRAPVRPAPSTASLERELEALDESVLAEVRDRLQAVRIGASTEDALESISGEKQAIGDDSLLDELVPATAGRGSGLLRAIGRQEDRGPKGSWSSRTIWDSLRSDIARDRATRRRVRRVHQWSWRVGTAAVVVLAVFLGVTLADKRNQNRPGSQDAARAKVRFVESSTPLFGYRSGASIVEEVRGD